MAEMVMRGLKQYEQHDIYNAMLVKLMSCPMPEFLPGIRGAVQGFSLTPAQTETVLKNALRYVPENLHEILAPEFLHELVTYGRIYAITSSSEGYMENR